MANFTLTQNATNVNNAINNVHNAQTTPTNGSATMVTSGGVYTAINNLTTANLTAATLVTQADGIASNDNETTLPTSAAVKDFVDTAVASMGSVATTTDRSATASSNLFINARVVRSSEDSGSISVAIKIGGVTISGAEDYGKEVSAEASTIVKSGESWQVTGTTTGGDNTSTVFIRTI